MAGRFKSYSSQNLNKTRRDEASQCFASVPSGTYKCSPKAKSSDHRESPAKLPQALIRSNIRCGHKLTSYCRPRIGMRSSNAIRRAIRTTQKCPFYSGGHGNLRYLVFTRSGQRSTDVAKSTVGGRERVVHANKDRNQHSIGKLFSVDTFDQSGSRTYKSLPCV